jgi:hypothetical protein
MSNDEWLLRAGSFGVTIDLYTDRLEVSERLASTLWLLSRRTTIFLENVTDIVSTSMPGRIEIMSSGASRRFRCYRAHEVREAILEQRGRAFGTGSRRRR